MTVNARDNSKRGDDRNSVPDQAEEWQVLRWENKEFPPSYGPAPIVWRGCLLGQEAWV